MAPSKFDVDITQPATVNYKGDPTPETDIVPTLITSFSTFREAIIFAWEKVERRKEAWITLDRTGEDFAIDDIEILYHRINSSKR